MWDNWIGLWSLVKHIYNLFPTVCKQCYNLRAKFSFYGIFECEVAQFF